MTWHGSYGKGAAKARRAVMRAEADARNEQTPTERTRQWRVTRARIAAAIAEDRGDPKVAACTPDNKEEAA